MMNFIRFYFAVHAFVLIFVPRNRKLYMNDDFSQPIPQGGDGAKDSENNRIAAIANQLEGLCAVYEAQS